MLIPTADLLADAEGELARAGCPTPRGDAYLLLAHALGISCETLLTNPTLIATEQTANTYRGFVIRRTSNREPIAYITGSYVFRHLRFRVDNRVLIPCIETELLVDAGTLLHHGASVIDIGTGCGAVALALKNERPDLDITATDISHSALEVAETNGEHFNLYVTWQQANLLEGLSNTFDAVLANLPYYPNAKFGSLDPELTVHEPSLALFTGSDELALIRSLLNQIEGRTDVKTVALEIRPDQGKAVADLLAKAGFTSAQRKADLTGAERAVVAHRS